MASTPALPGSIAVPANAQEQTGGLRLVAGEEVASSSFTSAWQALASEAAEPNPFFEPWFALASLDRFDRNRNCAFLAHFEGERLTGLLPVSRQRRYYGYPVPHASTWLHDNAFCGAPLVARGFERSFWRETLSHFDASPGSALFLHLPELPSDGPLNTALDAVLNETGRLAVTVENGTRAMLRSDLAPQAYFEAAMTAKKRKELRRQRKRLAELGELAFARDENGGNLDAWISDFLALEASGWKGEAGSALASAAETRAFFTDALMGAAKAGKLERLDLRLDGKPIAMLANFITPPGVFSFKTAFDERFARFSPGLLLQIENLDLLARPGFEWADSCAAPGHSMIERIWREKRRIVTRNIAIGGPLRRATFRALMAYETRG